MVASRIFAFVSTCVVALGVTPGLARAQDGLPAPTLPLATGLPIHQSFLKSDEGWKPFGDGAMASPVVNPIKVNSVDGALQLDYKLDAAKLSAFVYQVGYGALAQAKSFKFEIRSDYATTLIFGLQEQNGGRYLASFWVPKDKWQSVELTPADFTLANGPMDPPDPDQKLDLDTVTVLGLVDAGFVFGSDPAAAAIFGVQPGPHTLYMADFEINATALPGASGAAVPTGVLDAFSHPQVEWILLGATAKTMLGGPLPGRGMAVSYSQSPGKPAGMIHAVRTGYLSGSTKIAFSAASTHAANLIVQVEEVGGGKYNAQIYVPAGDAHSTDFSVSFADFKAAQDSKDSTGHIDLDQVKQILIIDATGMLGGVNTPTDNTLYVGDLRVIRP